MNNGYQEAVNWMNGMIMDGYIDPIFHVQGTWFERYFNDQMSKRNQCSLTNEQIKTRLSDLNGLENNRRAQEQEKMAGKRKKNTVASQLSKALDELEKELGADVLWNAGKKRFEVAWR